MKESRLNEARMPTVALCQWVGAPLVSEGTVRVQAVPLLYSFKYARKYTFNRFRGFERSSVSRTPVWSRCNQVIGACVRTARPMYTYLLLRPFYCRCDLNKKYYTAQIHVCLSVY
jgi:hypothetical protein